MSPRHQTDVRLSADPSASALAAEERDRTPRSILLLADFSGRGAAAGVPGPPTPRRVDRDVVDEVMAGLRPTVDLPGGATLGFESLDDFHPDALLRRVPRLGAILDGREAGDEEPETSRGSEGGDGGQERSKGSDAGRAEGSTSSGGAAGSAGLLGQILDQTVGPETRTPREAPSPSAPLDSVRAFAAEVARFDEVKGPDPERRARMAAAQERAADALRAFLRRPAFREMERRWRSVDFATRRLDTGPELHLYVADLSRAALAAETTSPRGLAGSALGAVLQKGAGPDGHPWTTVVLLDGRFGPSDADQLLLAWCTALCAAFGATLLVDGHPALAGVPDLDDFTEPTVWRAPDPGWMAFRRQPEARAVGVALPGFLLRYPYGADSDPIDTMPFEEIPGSPDLDDYLWGGGALACAVVLAREANREDPSALPDLSLGSLPLHTWRHGVDSGAVCGAAPMTDGAAKRILEAGLVPVAWHRGSDAVRLLVPKSAGGTPLV